MLRKRLFGNKKDPVHLPVFWTDYLKHFESTYSKETPLDAVRFVVFDTETTGLDFKTDQVLSIGAVSVFNWEIDLASSFECLIHQEYTPVGETIEIHGILPLERPESLTELHAVQAFMDFCCDSVLVGHHVAFDVAMINQILKEITGGRLKNKTVDTAALARRLNPPTYYARSGEYSLDHLCRQYDIPTNDRHTAAGDAYITGILFMKLLARLRARGVKTLGDVLKK